MGPKPPKQQTTRALVHTRQPKHTQETFVPSQAAHIPSKREQPSMLPIYGIIITPPHHDVLAKPTTAHAKQPTHREQDWQLRF
jgi:hypothetical protein